MINEKKLNKEIDSLMEYFSNKKLSVVEIKLICNELLNYCDLMVVSNTIKK